MLKILNCNSDLEVHGNTNLYGPLICPGSITIQNSQQATSDGAALYCDGGVIINKDAYVNGNLSVKGDLYCKPQQPKQFFASPSNNVGPPAFRPLIMADLPLLSISMPLFSAGEPLPLVITGGNVVFTCAYHYINTPAPNNIITSISDTFSSYRPPHSTYSVNVYVQSCILTVQTGNNISIGRSVVAEVCLKFVYTDYIGGVFVGKWYTSV